MKTINKKYQFTEEEALAHATFYGYNPLVVDETLLDENGNVPLVEAVNEDGTPRYEMDVEYDEDTMEEISSTERLDADGNPIRAMEPMNVYIDNPQTAVDYLSAHFDGFVKDWFMAPARKAAEDAAKLAKREAERATKDQLDMVEAGIKAKITTVIE